MGSSRQRPDSEIRDGSLSILCVDDDVDILMIVKLSLQLDPNVKVELARTADHALILLLSPKYRPDCILLDIEMPNFDGRLLLGEIREIQHHRLTPAIFLSAHVSRKLIQECRALGALGLISKPFDPLTLTAQVRSLLDRRTP